MLNIAQQDILNKFKAVQPKDIEVDFDSDLITVYFELNPEFDLYLYFNSDVSYPDDYSILCENTNYRGAILVSQYDSDLDEECNIDLSFMFEYIENYLVSEEYNKLNKHSQVFFEKSDLEGSWIAEKEYNNPMKAYGLSNSDFI